MKQCVAQRFYQIWKTKQHYNRKLLEKNLLVKANYVSLQVLLFAGVLKLNWTFLKAIFSFSFEFSFSSDKKSDIWKSEEKSRFVWDKEGERERERLCTCVCTWVCVWEREREEHTIPQICPEVKTDRLYDEVVGGVWW